jgi:hypothetical protein
VRFGNTGPDSAVTLSEGQGFGMIIVATRAGHDAAAQTIFAFRPNSDASDSGRRMS